MIFDIFKKKSKILRIYNEDTSRKSHDLLHQNILLSYKKSETNDSDYNNIIRILLWILFWSCPIFITDSIATSSSFDLDRRSRDIFFWHDIFIFIRWDRSGERVSNYFTWKIWKNFDLHGSSRIDSSIVFMILLNWKWNMINFLWPKFDTHQYHWIYHLSVKIIGWVLYTDYDWFDRTLWKLSFHTECNIW